MHLSVLPAYMDVCYMYLVPAEVNRRILRERDTLAMSGCEPHVDAAGHQTPDSLQDQQKAISAVCSYR